MRVLVNALKAACRIDNVAGVAASTNLAVAGAETEDIILIGWADNSTTGVPDKALEDLAFTSSGNAQTATDTTGSTVQVLWFDVSAFQMSLKQLFSIGS